MNQAQANGWKFALDNFARLLIAILVAMVGFLYAEIHDIRRDLSNHESMPSHPVMTERVANLQWTAERIEAKVDKIAVDVEELKKEK